MRFYRKKQHIFIALILVFELFVTSAFSASAISINLPSVSSVMSDIEKQLHLDPAALQNQGENLNVINNKGYAPEVSLSFSPSDPKEGEKISAKAFPIYFSNDEASLYFTWYLKRKGCELEDNPSHAKIAQCNRDTDKKITVEDWKIEAARILVQNGYTPDPSANVYSATSKDDDGYKAHFGGDNKVDAPSYCYIHDNEGGLNYELGGASTETSFTCPYNNMTAVCLVGEGVAPEDLFTASGKCSIAGYPVCSSPPTAKCDVGHPVCISTANVSLSPIPCAPIGTQVDPSLDDFTLIDSCAASNNSGDSCTHLFPDAPGDTTGDGKFLTKEERFWGTDPQDPSTADNGQKDEANVAGLGQSTFTWNYVTGDEVGVAVEGTSLFPTKYNNSSAMIMWAFPNKKCPPEKTGFAKQISVGGYVVNIPTANNNLDDCIHNNLVDPTRGGQATNLSVGVTATPDNPINDPGKDKSGDTVVAQATVDNAAQNLANIFFEWTVQISNNIEFNNGGTNKATDVTADLRSLGLLSTIKGNALDSIKVKLDIPDTKIKEYLGGSEDTGYIRFKVAATENFSDGVTRKGKSDVIVKFVSTQEIITAYKVNANPDPNPNGSMKVSLSGTTICNTDPLERTVCRVIKNEIIGLQINDQNLFNYYWTINGAPLLCTARVSSDCGKGKVDAEAQGDTNYFPVTGDPGDTYTVSVTANNVASGKIVTLARAFSVVEPKVIIESTDKSLAWPKFLGQYKDISGSINPVTLKPTCPSGYCDDLSESIFQATTGSTIGFRATFIPGFLALIATKEWSLDGEGMTESSPGEISFTADKPAPGIYTVNLLAQVIQPERVRRALLDIWGITPFESPEINFSVSDQVEIEDPLLTQGPLIGPRKYYAAIVSYFPASVLFTFRIFLSAALTLFALSFIHALLEERRVKAFVENFAQKRE